MDPANKPEPAINPPLTLLLGGVAAFGAYFAMYAVRKPFAAATYVDISNWHFLLDYKSALVIAQVLGYALSKLIGVRVIAEFGRRGRGMLILALIAAAWLALVAFALIPAPWNVACMFLNGLPLGMIWGLVFSYLEGRRASELLGAMLCANFIISPALVKSAAMLLLNAGLPELWMPAATGLMFAPLLLVSLWWLERLPPPDARDEAERTVRAPMRRADRAAFLRAHGLPILMLVLGYVLLTALRDFRDNFATELWVALGFGGDASIFSTSEIPVAVISLSGLAALMLVRDNVRALLAMHGMIVLGAALLGFSTLAFQLGLLPPLPWIILTGAGLYLGYIPYNAMLFDRMIAVIGTAGNTGFLIYIADASGYAGSVVMLLLRSFAAPKVDWVPFYAGSAYVTAIAIAVLTSLSAIAFVTCYWKRRSHAAA